MRGREAPRVHSVWAFTRCMGSSFGQLRCPLIGDVELRLYIAHPLCCLRPREACVRRDGACPEQRGRASRARPLALALRGDEAPWSFICSLDEGLRVTQHLRNVYHNSARPE